MEPVRETNVEMCTQKMFSQSPSTAESTPMTALGTAFSSPSATLPAKELPGVPAGLSVHQALLGILLLAPGP